jgi:signal transduction histidine kinase
MRRPSLLQSLLWRALIIVFSTLVILYLIAMAMFGGYLQDQLRRQLQQEAYWTASVFGSAPDPQPLIENWRISHPSVRLQLFNAEDGVMLDSLPVQILTDDFQPLRVEAPLANGQRLRLSRAGMVRHPLHPWFIPLLIGLLGFAALVLYPLVRQLTRNIEALSLAARDIADRHFGATLQPPRQRELAGLVGSFNDMSQRLARADQQQKRLISDVSHELRSPLGRLRALGETIARRPEAATPYLRQIDQEIALLDRLVGDMLEMARVDGDGDWLKLGPVCVSDWAEDAFARCAERARSAGLDVEIEISPSSRTLVLDAERLLQALGNLVDNAIAAVQGRPNPAVRLTHWVAEDAWGISVADNGCGIAADHLAHLFDRFYRVESHRGHRSGVGLGLSICRAIIEAHGGSIVIESRLGEGSAASWRVPLADPTLSRQF